MPEPAAWSRVHPWARLAVRLALAGVMLAAGGIKLMDLPASVRAVRAYELLPESLAVLVGNGLPVLEVLLGLLLLVGLFTRFSAVASGLLMVVFIVGVISAWARGLAIDCGCFGGGGAVDPDQTAYWEEIVRDAALLAGAVVLAAWPRVPLSLDLALDLTD